MYEGECPCCGKHNLIYYEIEFYDDQCFFPRECRDCGATGEEWYQLNFIGHENIETEEESEKKLGDSLDKLNSYLKDKIEKD